MDDQVEGCTALHGPAAADTGGVAVAAPEVKRSPRSRSATPHSRRGDIATRVPAGRISTKCRRLLQKYFPGVPEASWNDWRWQLRHRFRCGEQLAQVLSLSGPEEEALGRSRGLPVAVTPYYLSLLDPRDPSHPLRRSVIPVSAEFHSAPCEAEDPLGEESMSPVAALVHRYPDRVLFLVTGRCAVNCRYCTRSRVVAHDELAPDPARWDEAIAYIARTSSVRDVLISGGDPLTMGDGRIEYLLSRLRAIRHVEIIRIGTKVPVVLPQRITPGLTRVLRRYHPLWFSIHFTHPDEITPEVEAACARLADAGIPLGSQTVLLQGINDDVETMGRLFRGLMRIRVRPYYLYQCDPITGSSHFRTPVAKGLEIIKGLRGHTSGYAVPHFVIDAPGGGGKVPLAPDYVVGREDGSLVLRNYEGRTYRYPDPACVTDTGGE